MSGLVERVREKVRSRSLSRKRRSTTQSRDEVAQHPHPSQYVDGDGRTSQDLSNENPGRLSSSAAPSWHVHKGVRTSMDNQSQPPVPQVNQRYNNETAPMNSNSGTHAPYTHRHTASNTSDNMPARYSSLRNETQSADYQNSQGQTRDNLSYGVPPRKESLPQNRYDEDVGVHYQTNGSRMQEVSHDMTRAGENRGENRGRTNALPPPNTSNDLGTEIDQALADLSGNERDHNNGLVSATTTRKPVPQNVAENLRTPAGFDLGNSVHTHIDTEWRQAVTHEDVYHERTEIITEAITRDIHVHHYYTYVQPIKVVEVLPTKHYVLDEKTGMKTEIAAPAGWKLPVDMTPRRQDTSALSGWSRHYLVNEQYPNGIPEPPPSSDTDINGQREGHSYTIGAV